MKRTKSQLNAIYYARRDRAERRRNAWKALYGWIGPGGLSEHATLCLKNVIESGGAGEFVRTCNGFRESRRSINWDAVGGGYRWTWHYVAFERYRAAVRAQKSPYYRRRLAKFGLDWKYFDIPPYGTEGIDLD